MNRNLKPLRRRIRSLRGYSQRREAEKWYEANKHLFVIVSKPKIIEQALVYSPYIPLTTTK